MGDYGKTYSTYTPQMCEEMKKLVGYADILTPNVEAEACILTDTPYREKFRMQEYACMAEQLSEKGPKKIVITGIVQGDFIANYCYERGESRTYYAHIRSGHSAPVPAIFLRRLLQRMRGQRCAVPRVSEKASRFIKKCIQRSLELEIPVTDGVCFEEVLGTLR